MQDPPSLETEQNFTKLEPEEIKKMLADSFSYHNKKKTEKLEEKIPSSSIPWDVIDTCSEDSDEEVFCANKQIGVDEDDEELQNTEYMPDVAICLICNENFQDPVLLETHMAKTGHKNFEMMDCMQESEYQFYEDEMSLSFFIFKNYKKNGHKTNEEGKMKNAIYQEFIEFFEIRDFDLQSERVLNLFMPRIMAGMESSVSFFGNKKLKTEMYDFIETTIHHRFKCQSCTQPAFSTLSELKAHVERDSKLLSKKSLK